MAILASAQPIGFGVMNFTCIPSQKFTQQQFDHILKEIIDGSKATETNPLFLNGGEFYGLPDRNEGLRLLGNFFANYPQYADVVILSIKGGVKPNWFPDTSTENLNATVDVIEKYLQPLYAARKSRPRMLDMFTLSRVGDEPIEQVMRVLERHKANNRFASICLSEVNASTLERAVAVGSVDAIEIELSLSQPEPITNGLFAVCAQHNITVAAYSPLGKGVLVGRKSEDLPTDDLRQIYDRFTDPQAVKHNEILVRFVHDMAEKLNMTPAKLALSWVLTLSGQQYGDRVNPQVIPLPGGTNAQRQLDNFASEKLSLETMHEIGEFLKHFKTAGHRYNKVLDQLNSR